MGIGFKTSIPPKPYLTVGPVGNLTNKTMKWIEMATFYLLHSVLVKNCDMKRYDFTTYNFSMKSW